MACRTAREWPSIAVMGRSRLAKLPEPSALPMARYFAVVGGALAALLLIIGWSLPRLPDRFPDRANGIDAATIRIASARKWPEKVVLDTSQPTMPPLSIGVVPIQELAERLPDERTDQMHADSSADFMAESKPVARPITAEHPPMRSKRKRARAGSSAHVASARSPSELQGLSAECCWFEPMDRRIRSRPALRSRVARRDSWTGWHFPEAN
jgi:hypothetical protein